MNGHEYHAAAHNAFKRLRHARRRRSEGYWLALRERYYAADARRTAYFQAVRATEISE